MVYKSQNAMIRFAQSNLLFNNNEVIIIGSQTSSFIGYMRHIGFSFGTSHLYDFITECHGQTIKIGTINTFAIFLSTPLNH